MSDRPPPPPPPPPQTATPAWDALPWPPPPPPPGRPGRALPTRTRLLGAVIALLLLVAGGAVATRSIDRGPAHPDE
ncbi:MAG TPA: hypothetical protein VFK43_09590, partial [Acidimicrobiales bacterium]|nr:hypothetical protein [Acidimicrobiales bacterium]